MVEIQPVALESAYGRTPFFEYYIDRLMPLFDQNAVIGIPGHRTHDSRADAIIRKILGIDTQLDKQR